MFFVFVEAPDFERLAAATALSAAVVTADLCPNIA
jgi:hypothetical protein